MRTSSSFDTRRPSAYVEQGFSGFGYGSYNMGYSMANSPIQSLAFLPGGDPSSWRQSSLTIDTTLQEEGSVPSSSYLNANISSSPHDQLYPPDPCFISPFNPQYSDTPSVMQCHHPSMTFSSLSLNPVVHTPSMTPYSSHHGSLERVRMPSHYGGNLISVEEPQSFDPTTYPPYRQIQPTPDGVARNYSILTNPANQATIHPQSLTTRVPTNSRGAHSIPNSPYHLTRASSFPAQSVSPSEIVQHACRWINDDGTMCMESISRLSISEHLISHGITKLGHDYLLQCRWEGCRLRGGKVMIKRESIARHIREKHLQYGRRSTN